MDPSSFDLDESRAETRAAFENRALLYAAIYEELADEVGEDRAAAIMKRAIYHRGLDIGRKYRPAASTGDFEEIGRIFCEGSPCQGELFEPGVEEVDEDHTVLRMTACPLVDAWRAAGLDATEVDTLCEIAAAVDEGTFEGAGLELEFLDRIGRRGSSSCLLRLTLPQG